MNRNDCRGRTSRRTLRISTFVVAALLASASLQLAIAANAQEQDSRTPIGRVVSLQGSAAAVSPGGESRSLACDSVVYEGDRLSTDAAASLGVLTGSVYTGVAESTQVEVAGGEAVRLSLAVGHIRVVDASSQGEASIATPDIEAQSIGRDAEAIVAGSEGSASSKICSWRDSIEVTALGGASASRSAKSGSCAVRSAGGRLAGIDGAYPPLALASGESCREQRIAAVGLDDHLSPADVETIRVPRIPELALMARPHAIPCPLLGDACSHSAGRAGGATVPVVNFPGFLVENPSD
jgi:hypothetical protein